MKEWLRSLAPVPLPSIKALMAAPSLPDVKRVLGNAFLLARKPVMGLADTGHKTLWTTTLKSLNGNTPEASPWSDAAVFLVRATGRCAFPDFISVGRTKQNDIVIPDDSISKFHAFFCFENGDLVIYDAASHNGTFVDGQRIPRRDDGAPRKLQNDTLIRFGGVELAFLDAEGLRDALGHL